MTDDPIDLILPEDVFHLEVAQPVAVRTPARLVALPRAHGELIGRERELAEAFRLLRDEDGFLVTVTGAGGTGKTRLALEAARGLVDTFADGVAFVPLAPLRDPGLVASKIAQALSLTEGAGGSRLEILKQELRERELLLVLDNFEHLLSAAPLVGELLSEAPGVKALVTSRALLRISGEQELALAPLELPDPRHLPPPELLSRNAAVEMFVGRAKAARGGFELTDENARAVAEICLRLDGLPLALELAAARIKLLSPEALRDRLRDHLALLGSGVRDRQPHQQSLRATIEWSHGLLEPAEQRLFARLAIFAGGFTLEAAEAVCADQDDDRGVVESIASLLDNSLLRRSSPLGKEPRFAMLMTIHEYAFERLEQNREAEEVWHRHAVHFLELAERAAPELRAGSDPSWLIRLEVEHDNLRAALRRALERRDGERALRLSGALWRFWRDHGHVREGRQWLEDAVALGAGQPAALRAKAHDGLSAILEIGGDLDGSRVHGQASLALYREIGDVVGVADSLFGLALAADVSGDSEGARRLLGEAIPYYRQAGDEAGLAYADANFGIWSSKLGDYAEATARLENALEHLRRIGDETGVAWVLQGLAFVALSQQRTEDAIGVLDESLARSQAWDLRNREVAACIGGAAAVAASRGELPTAARLLGAADALLHTSGDWKIGEVESRVLERTSNEVEAELGSDAFGACVAEGRALAYDDAVAEALRALDDAKRR